MRKSLQFVAMLALLVWGVSAEAQVKRRALIENITGAWCQFCPDGTVKGLELKNTMGDKLVFVQIHNQDAMAITEEGLLAQPFISGYPSGLVDRKLFSGRTKVGVDRGQWATLAPQRANLPVQVDVQVTRALFNPETRKLVISLKANFVSAVSGEVRFNAYVVEDSVSGTGSGYDQVNAYNTQSGHPMAGKGNPIKGYHHRFVVRQMMGGAWGTGGEIPNNPAASSSYSHTYELTVPATWNEKKITVVGLAQMYNTDANKREVLNCVQVPIVEGVPPLSVESDPSFAIAAPAAKNTSSVRVINSTQQENTYKIAIVKSSRTPSDWTAKLGDGVQSQITIPANSELEVPITLTPGATLGIGDVSLKASPVGMDDLELSSAPLTVLHNQFESLQIYVGATHNSNDIIINSGRPLPKYFLLTANDFPGTAVADFATMPNLKHIVWNMGDNGSIAGVSSQIDELLDKGIGMLFIGTRTPLYMKGSSTFGKLGIAGGSELTTVGISNGQAVPFTTVGYASDPISGGLNLSSQLFSAALVSLTISNSTTTKAILKPSNNAAIIGVRCDLENARAVVIPNHGIFADPSVLIGKALTWIEAKVAAAPKPAVTLSSTEVDFGEIETNVAKTKSLNIKNSGGADLIIRNFTIDNDTVFSVKTNVTNAITVKAGASVDIEFQALAKSFVSYHTGFAFFNTNIVGNDSLVGVMLNATGKEITSVPYGTSADGAVSLSVGPNPASSNATLQYTVHADMPQTATMQVMDERGAIVYTTTVATSSKGVHTIALPVQQLASGSYTVTLHAGKTATFTKVVVAK